MNNVSFHCAAHKIAPNSICTTPLPVFLPSFRFMTYESVESITERANSFGVLKAKYGFTTLAGLNGKRHKKAFGVRRRKFDPNVHPTGPPAECHSALFIPMNLTFAQGENPPAPCSRPHRKRHLKGIGKAIPHGYSAFIQNYSESRSTTQARKALSEKREKSHPFTTRECGV